MKIRPYFKTTLATPFQGKFLHQVGATVVMNTDVHTKSIGDFMIMLPDPVSLNLNNAQGFINKCEKIKERINKAKGIQVFSKTLNEDSIRGLDINAIKKLDPEAGVFRTLDNEKVFEYVQSSMGVVASLITAVESFVNLIIPYNYTHERINKKGESEVLTKEQVVRKFSIEDKLDIVAKIKSKTDLKQQKFWVSFKTAKDLRDDVIHFKKMDNNIKEMWSPIIASFFDSDLQKLLNDFVELIGYLHPDYLTVEE